MTSMMKVRGKLMGDESKGDAPGEERGERHRRRKEEGIRKEERKGGKNRRG